MSTTNEYKKINKNKQKEFIKILVINAVLRTGL